MYRNFYVLSIAIYIVCDQTYRVSKTVLNTLETVLAVMGEVGATRSYRMLREIDRLQSNLIHRFFHSCLAQVLGQ